MPDTLPLSQAARSDDWASAATQPSYDRLRGQEGSPRWIACLGKTDDEIRALDRKEKPMIGSWMEMMKRERGE